MGRFQILCVTMKQKDFSKIKEMNITSDIIFANQSNITNFESYSFNGHLAKMITTTTIGVGNNRNISLMYADADICLLSDDDMTYCDDLENIVIGEFERNKDADVIIFNIDSNSPERPQRKNYKTKRVHWFNRMPYGAVRIAFRLPSIRKANIFFSTLFGGGALFPAGEDSIFIHDMIRSGLKIYVSDKTIGSVKFESSTWFDGYNEKYYYGKGAYCAAVHPITKKFWMLYYALRTKSLTELKIINMYHWMKNGAIGFKKLCSFETWLSNYCS